MSVIFEGEAEIAGVWPTFVVRDEAQAQYFRDSNGAPEAPLIDWAYSLVQDDPKAHFVDVGAHVGTWCITLAKAGVWVTAFEAQHDLAKMCNQGFKLNDLEPRCFAYAMSDITGSTILTAPYSDGGGGSIVRKFENPAITAEVQLKTLDFFMLDHPQPPTLIKIDTEGAEVDVLHGGHKTIARYQPKIIFECWEDELGQRKEELFRYFYDVLDYSVVPVSWRDTWLAEPR